MSRPKSATGKIMSLLTTMESGDYFYVDMAPNVVTSYANKVNKKIRTQKVFLMEDTTTTPKIIKGIKVIMA